MNIPSIPDEVVREIKLASKSEEVIRDTYCDSAFTAENAYKNGAQAFYLKGREDMAREIIDHLEETGELLVANGLKEKFLKGIK